jgi:hypothetical protein
VYRLPGSQSRLISPASTAQRGTCSWPRRCDHRSVA